MLDWSDEELAEAGLSRKRVESIVRRLRRISGEMRDLQLHVYGASGSGHLMHESRPSHDPRGKAHPENSIAHLGLGFDGGDW
jgi:hypothetical protein